MKRLLLVDDDADVLEALALVLSKHFDVVAASGGAEALRQLAAAPFDVLLLDLMMPLMDGEAVLAAMARADLRVPVVLGSALPDLRDIAARHAVAWIAKPFEVPHLVEKLRTLAG